MRRSIEAAETGRSGNPQLAGEAADQRAERAQAGRVGGDQRLPRRARRVEDAACERNSTTTRPAPIGTAPRISSPACGWARTIQRPSPSSFRTPSDTAHMSPGTAALTLAISVSISMRSRGSAMAPTV